MMIEAKGNKKVKIIETDKSENKQVKAGQKTMDNFMKISNRPSAIQRTPPTPTEKHLLIVYFLCCNDFLLLISSLNII
jgi:hypothetical protein